MAGVVTRNGSEAASASHGEPDDRATSRSSQSAAATFMSTSGSLSI